MEFNIFYLLYADVIENAYMSFKVERCTPFVDNIFCKYFIRQSAQTASLKSYLQIINHQDNYNDANCICQPDICIYAETLRY